MPSVNLTIILPIRTFNYLFLISLAVRDHPVNKIIMNMKEIKNINLLLLHELHDLF